MDIKISLQAEISKLDKMIKETPTECVIDILSMRNRRQKVIEEYKNFIILQVLNEIKETICVSDYIDDLTKDFSAKEIFESVCFSLLNSSIFPDEKELNEYLYKEANSNISICSPSSVQIINAYEAILSFASGEDPLNENDLLQGLLLCIPESMLFDALVLSHYN